MSKEGKLTLLAVVLFFGVVGGLVTLAIVTDGPHRWDLCRDNMADSSVYLSSHEAPNGNILCKIIDADSVERSVWLDGDGVVLK